MDPKKVLVLVVSITGVLIVTFLFILQLQPNHSNEKSDSPNLNTASVPPNKLKSSFEFLPPPSQPLPQTQTAITNDLSPEEQQQVLAPAQAQAKDALLHADLHQILVKARMDYADSSINFYEGICSRLFVVEKLNHIKTAAGLDSTCNASVTAFATASSIATEKGKFWCVDSTGFEGIITTPLGTNTLCKNR